MATTRVVRRKDSKLEIVSRLVATQINKSILSAMPSDQRGQVDGGVEDSVERSVRRAQDQSMQRMPLLQGEPKKSTCQDVVCTWRWLAL